jgi:hypothetical protein
MRISRLCILALYFFVGCGRTTTYDSWNGKLTNRIPESVRIALENAPEFELLSLDPRERDEDSPSEFYRRKVIGKILVKDMALRDRLLAVLDAGVREPATSSKCFDPRHAIRVRNGGKTFYLTICFHCHHVYVFVDDRLNDKFYFPTAYSPLPVFDEVLKSAGVPLAEDGMLDQPQPKPTTQ